MTLGTIGIIFGVLLLVLLTLFFKNGEDSSQNNRSQGSDHDDIFKEEPEFDRTWSILPGNIFHRSNDD